MIFLAIFLAILLVLVASFVVYTVDRWGDESLSIMLVMLLPIALTVSIVLLSDGEILAGSLMLWVGASSLTITISALHR